MGACPFKSSSAKVMDDSGKYRASTSSAKVVDDSGKYRARWEPTQDDGLPLSALLACPFVVSLYNSGAFPSLVPLATKTQEEEWKGWAASPAHVALYESAVSKDEVTQALLGINFSDDTAQLVAKLVCVHEGGTAVRIFQGHDSKSKHGEATRIRYDPEACTPGFSQARFDAWWDGLDKNADGKMDKDEMKEMLGDLDRDEADASAPQSRDFFKKIPVFTLIYYGFKGDETGGVDRDVVEALYKGTWRDKLARNLPLKTLLWNVFIQLLTGAA